jgi:general secretion pathway protein B
MSYILDALRKSEQQRQAIQPDTVTDRILANPVQAKQKPTQWIIALVIVNLLVICYLAWFFTQKSAVELQPNTPIAGIPEQQPLPVIPKKQAEQAAVTAQDRTSQTTAPSAIVQTKPQTVSPSIAQLIEAQKMAAIQQTNPKPIVEKKAEKKAEKKPVAVKKEPLTRDIEAAQMRPEMPELEEEKPSAPTTHKSTPDLNELTYEVRNNLPNLNINVFSYDHQPEDRFVIIDMVKYKTGQLIKGSVKLKEIRQDSIVLEYGGNTFKVERP